jgi:hypothetical protein
MFVLQPLPIFCQRRQLSIGRGESEQLGQSGPVGSFFNDPKLDVGGVFVVRVLRTSFYLMTFSGDIEGKIIEDNKTIEKT